MHPYFTDSLDNPIAEGDIILYPVCSGSSSAHYHLARVAEIDPIVTADDGKDYFKSMAVRPPSKRGEGVPYSQKHIYKDPTKRYRLRVERIRERGHRPWNDSTGMAKSFILNVDRVVVVTPIYNPRPDDRV